MKSQIKQNNKFLKEKIDMHINTVIFLTGIYQEYKAIKHQHW